MPSYYDSKKKQPGKAEVKYKKGGKVKYDEGGTVKPKPRKRKPSYRKKVSKRLATKAREAERLETEGRIRDAEAKREVQESINRLRREGKFRRMSEEDRAAREKKEEADWAAGINIEKKSYGGKIKKMKGGGTVARGSGAARTQHFGKNG